VWRQASLKNPGKFLSRWSALLIVEAFPYITRTNRLFFPYPYKVYMSYCDKAKCNEAIISSKYLLPEFLYGCSAYRSIDQVSNHMETILHHITECCGHTTFFEELAALLEKDRAQLMSLLCKLHSFVIYLGMILTKDIVDTETYDNLLGCIPVIADGISWELANSRSTRELTGEKMVIFKGHANLSMLKDFNRCSANLEYFAKLLPARIQSFEFMVSDLEKLTASGEKLDDAVLDLCAHIRDRVDRMRDYIRTQKHEPENYVPFISVFTSDGISNKSPSGYRTYWKYYDYEKKREFLGDANQIQPFVIKRYLRERESKTVFLPSKELGRLLDLAYQYGFPIYINGWKISLYCNSRGKSARM